MVGMKHGLGKWREIGEDKVDGGDLSWTMLLSMLLSMLRLINP